MYPDMLSASAVAAVKGMTTEMKVTAAKCKKLSVQPPKPELSDFDGTCDDEEEDPSELLSKDFTDRINNANNENACEARKFKAAMRTWKAKEMKRQEALTMCVTKATNQKEKATIVANAYKASKAAYEDVEVAEFPASLEADMKAYNKEAGAHSRTKATMEGTEHEDTIASVDKMIKYTDEFKANAVKRGEDNQSLKKEMIA
jgi:hypothetical protein